MVYLNNTGVFILVVTTVNMVSSFQNNILIKHNTSYFCKSIVFKFKVTNEFKFLEAVKDAFFSFKRTLNVILRLLNELKSSVPDPKTKSVYLENVSNTFALLRRISNLWPPRLSLMNMAFGQFIKKPEVGSSVNFFTEEMVFSPGILQGELTEYMYHPINTTVTWRSALIGLVRLQETYNLSTADLAAGLTPGASGSTNSTVLSAKDCYDIGVYCLLAGIPVRAIEWASQASLLAGDDPGVSTRRLHEYIQIASCYTGDTKGYRDTVHRLFEDPLFAPTNKLYKYYGDMMKMNCKTLKHIYGDDPFNLIRDDLQGAVQERSMCRKDWLRRIQQDNVLKCRLIHYNQPYLRIGPLKVEELNIDPPVLIFHQVASEDEMRDLIKESYNQIMPAVIDYGSKYDKYQDTQLNRWMREWNSDLLEKWNRKTKMIANAGIQHSESPMVASYGLAAEIRLHNDLGPDDGLLNPFSRGDYITLMFWLNQPEEGGFTIFPFLNLTVAPMKGSAILWFNRHPTWERDERVAHSGCPILTGTKWVLTKWFHVLEQAFPKCVPVKERTRQYYYLESNI